MRLVKKTVEVYETPIEVYDTTNLNGNANFQLANGLIIHNSLKMGSQKVMESEEVIHILGAIGYDPKAEDPYSKLQVSKIICLADPDADGLHINVLLLTLFYKFLPRLFDMGMVYVADTPEFYSELKDGTVISGKTLSEVHQKLVQIKAPKGTTINHIKGYGEIDAPLVRQLALDPATRTLIQLKTGSKEATSMFERLMNEDVQFRREHLLKIEDQ